jgi:hypothetical protein
MCIPNWRIAGVMHAVRDSTWPSPQLVITNLVTEVWPSVQVHLMETMNTQNEKTKSDAQYQMTTVSITVCYQMLRK